MDKPLYQNDPRWKNHKIGLQNNLTIEQVGCMLTCFAMTVNHFGANETPDSLNEKMKASGGFAGAWIKGAKVPGQFPQTGLERQMHVECKGEPAPVDLIDQGLEAGSLVMVRVDWTPDANIDSHWVVIYGKKDDDYKIWDPWQKNGAADTLKGRYGFGSKEPADIILEAIWHGKGDFPKSQDKPAAASGKTTKTVKQAKKAPSDDRVMAVQPTVAQLTMRSRPVVNASNIIKSVTANDVLIVLDSYQEGQAKIGKQGQWFHVKDSSGATGYIAAWYVKQVPAPTDTPAETSEPAKVESKPTPAASTTIKVKPTTSSLSFRSHPYVADNTLIRYLSGSDVLTAVNPDDASKIGKQGQWLKVKASDGTEGYVAAWFVVKA